MPEFMRLGFTMILFWCMNYHTDGLSNYHVKSRLYCQCGEGVQYLIKSNSSAPYMEVGATPLFFRFIRDGTGNEMIEPDADIDYF